MQVERKGFWMGVRCACMRATTLANRPSASLHNEKNKHSTWTDVQHLLKSMTKETQAFGTRYNIYIVNNKMFARNRRAKSKSKHNKNALAGFMALNCLSWSAFERLFSLHVSTTISNGWLVTANTLTLSDIDWFWFVAFRALPAAKPINSISEVCGCKVNCTLFLFGVFFFFSFLLLWQMEEFLLQRNTSHKQ